MAQWISRTFFRALFRDEGRRSVAETTVQCAGSVEGRAGSSILEKARGGEQGGWSVFSVWSSVVVEGASGAGDGEGVAAVRRPNWGITSGFAKGAVTAVSVTDQILKYETKS